jgi:uncharacterized membrane protein
MLAPARQIPVDDRAERSAPDAAALDLWLLAGLIVLGAALRFATISAQSYWLDESTTVHEMSMSLGALLHAVHVNETTPPLYFVVAWLWSKLFGAGELGLRSLSALAGVAVIPITYQCGRELVSRRAGLVAAALATVNPFLVWYSQEARSYMLLTAFCGASLIFFARARNDHTARSHVWWAAFSILAILTHFFAGFLIAPEAVLLLYAARSRVSVTAVGAVAVAQLAVLPLAIGDTSHPLNWLSAFPLSVRVQQVPVEFGLSSLYQSSLVTYGLLGAAILCGCLIALLVIGASRSELTGAGIAAGLALFVVLVPLILAVLGRDYYIARNLLPAWIPLAVVIGAACTTRRARAPGAVLAVVLLGLFIWAGIRIDGNPQYQRPDWRGLAATLGPATGPRAIVAYDGTSAAGPLAVYLPGVRWTAATQAPPPATVPVRVTEVDVVANDYIGRPKPLPAGTRLISARRVHGYIAERFALSPAWTLTSAQISDRAAGLMSPPSDGSSVVLQDVPGA